ncbi:MAG: hypothetical protein U9Q39_07620, partial [Pseudomonadota bacterium]|nr:hypothetical protein [Pseudomonadota bacterium]
MQDRNSLSQCIIISFLACFFLLLQPLVMDSPIQSTALAGNQGWNDAFGNSQGKNSPSINQSGTTGGGW